MSLPYLVSYPDPKLDEAYRRYQDGGSQREIAAALGIPYRTLARRSTQDGWEAERKTRRLESEIPIPAEVAAVAAADAPGRREVAAPAASPDGSDAQPVEQTGETLLPDGEPAATSADPRLPVGDMLARQQRFASRLVAALDRASADVLEGLAGKPARLVIGQTAQLLTLGGKALEMERKAYRIPDKVEVEDKTPTQGDRVRALPDEQLNARLEQARRQAMEAERRGGTAPSRGEAPAPSVN